MKPISEIQIREYCSKDACALHALFFDTVRQVNNQDYSAEQVKAWAPHTFDAGAWQQKMDEICPFIAHIGGQIIGYADLQHDGYIDHFFCHYQYQGVGVGSALMRHILAQGKKRQLLRFYADVSITAKPFFQYFGFQVEQEKKVFIRGEKLVNFSMVKWGHTRAK